MLQNKIFKEFSVNIRPNPRCDLVTPYKVRVTFTTYRSSQGVESSGLNVVFGPADTPEKHKLFVNCAAASGVPSRLSGDPAPAWLIQAVLASVTCQLMAEIEKRKLSDGDPLDVAELHASLGLNWSAEA